MDVGVLQTIQLHLRERHTFAPAAAKEKQDEIEAVHESRSVRTRRNSTASHTTATPKPAEATETGSEENVNLSPFIVMVNDALSRNDTNAVIDHIQWLVDPSNSPALLYSEPTVTEFNFAIRTLIALKLKTTTGLLVKLYNALLARGLTPNLGTYIHMIVGLTEQDHEVQKSLQVLEYQAKRARLSGRAAAHVEEIATQEFDQKRKATLLAKDDFATAMSIFEAACVTAPRANKAESRGVPLALHFPLSVYHGLLRSCAAHANVDAAIRVYTQLESRSQSSRKVSPSSPTRAKSPSRGPPPFYPSSLVFYQLLSTYINAGDLAGAKEVLAEFQELSSKGLLMHSEGKLKSQIQMWNKMMEAHFRAGQPAGALRLLEMMMDGESSTKDPAVPPPASSTFTTIISGFCSPSPSSDAPNPDIESALSWFDRLLQQPSASQDPYEPTQSPSRPDQLSWIVMLNALAHASTENKAYLKDLNRLFDILVKCAPEDGLEVRAVDMLMAFDANLHFLEEVAEVHEADVQNEGMGEQARASLEFIARHFPDGTANLSGRYPGPNHLADDFSRAYPHFVRFGMAQEGWEIAERLVAFEEKVILHNYPRSKEMAKCSKAAVSLVLPTAFEAAVSPNSPTLVQTLPITRLAGRLAIPPTLSIASHHLHAYLTAPVKSRLELSPIDQEMILLCALVLPVQPSSADKLSPPGCAYTGLMGLLRALSDAQVNLRKLTSKITTRVTEALYTNFNEHDISCFLGELHNSFHALELPLAKRSDEQREVPRAPTPPPMSTYPAGIPTPAEHIVVDADVSRQIDQWFPSHSSFTVHDSYAALQGFVSRSRYPHPASLGRLINGLGRARDIAAVQWVYSIAQQLIFSPFVSQNSTWQSQAWFQIEDHMIIAYAHTGDMETAFAHRDRITAAGGVPSPDAYGSLIECVKDTTDDTSNAMALFAESQMLGTKPNVYLYNTIISKLAKARKADFALELFQQMKGNTSLRPSSITYGAVIAACARVGDSSAAEQLFEEMASQSNFKPRIPPYNTMMQMYAHTKPDRERVLHYFSKMTGANIEPSAHTYKLLIDAYGTIEPIDVNAMEDVFKRIEASRNAYLQSSHWAALINAYGCVLKDLDKAISIFESIPSHPSANRGTPLPDSVTYESLISVLVTHKRMDLAQSYLARLQASGVHMTAYIANLLIKGYAADGAIDEARSIFENLADPASGVAAPGNHVPHDSTCTLASPSPISYREPSTWEAMFRAELGNGDRDRAVALLERLQQRQFPHAVYNRIRGIMLDDSVSPWGQSPEPHSPSPSPSP
jgi:pentatricopeptide repeat protein